MANEKNVVLITDNAENDVALLKQAMAEIKFECETFVATSCAEAVTLVQEYWPDLVIVDIDVCKDATDKFEIIKYIRHHRLMDDVPIVVFTTSTQPEDINTAYTLQAGYIIKPKTFSELVGIMTVVKGYCEERRARKRSNLNRIRQLTDKLEALEKHAPTR